jgi:hypothetical protein
MKREKEKTYKTSIQWAPLNGITLAPRQTDYINPMVLNLLVLQYPQIKIVPFCIPPNQNCTPLGYPQIQNSTLIVFLRSPFDLLAYPL